MARFEKRLTFSSPRVRVEDARQAVLRERLKAVRHYLAQLQKEREPAVETVHQLRVWSRRATAAVDLFSALGSERAWAKLRKRLKKIRQALSDVRDWDVLTARIAADKAFGKRVQDQLARERQAAREAIVARILDQDKVFSSDKLQKLQKKVLESPGAAGKGSFRRFMTAQSSALVDRFREIGEEDLKSPEMLHEFRIAGKELRYALEIALAVFPSRKAERLYDELTELQDELGAVCDHRAAAEQFESLMKRFRSVESKRVFRAAAKAERAKCAAGAEKFLARWTPEARLSWAARCDKMTTAGKPR